MTYVPASPLVLRSSNAVGSESSTQTLRAPARACFQGATRTRLFELTMSVTFAAAGLFVGPVAANNNWP